MKCPKCKEKMTEAGKDSTANAKEKKRYSRTIFHCKKDDIWVSVETPEGKVSTLIYG